MFRFNVEMRSSFFFFFEFRSDIFKSFASLSLLISSSA